MLPTFKPSFQTVNDGPHGQRFCIHHPPALATPLGLVVHVHPFAEEMNKSRRMAAQQARALAAAGFAVLQIDLLGCGDSAGDSSDATWAAWLADVVWAARHLRALHGTAGHMPLWLWGHRAGALLATQAAEQLAAEDPPHLLLWQPSSAGNSVLQQFLRLKMAAGLASGGGKGVTEALKRQLAEGQTVEVAGYVVHPALAQGLEAARLRPPPRPSGTGQLVWIEVAAAEAATLSPAASQASVAWQAAGWQVHTQLVQGPAFWQTTEIEDAPALIPATLQALLAAGHAAPASAAPRPVVA
jgi:exosortase A-associated hydrolase 2